MENIPDNRFIDSILRSHYRRIGEARVLCVHRTFHPPQRPLPSSPVSVASTQKRAPSLTIDEAVRTGAYNSALAMSKHLPVNEVSKICNIPASTVRDAIKRNNETGSPMPRKRGRKEGTGTIFTEEAITKLQDFIDLHPDVTLVQMRDYISLDCERAPSTSTISRILKNINITNKTLVRIPKDRNTPEMAQKRVEWSITWRNLQMTGARFIYVDEAGFSLHLTAKKGWAVVGFSPEIEAASGRGKNISLLAALVPGRKIECYMLQDGSITGEIFANWITNSLVPYLRAVFGSRPCVIVLDNAACHGCLATEAITRSGYRYLKTVPYSPQLNAIERAFSQIKNKVSRRVSENTASLKEQIIEGIKCVTEENTNNYEAVQWHVTELILRGFLIGSDHIFRFVETE